MLQKTPKIKRAKTADEALASLMRLCARAERSSGDALRLMQNWGVAKEEQYRVLQRLQSERFIDDRRYAEAFVREKCNLSAWGRYKIQSALMRKGIASDIIAEALVALHDRQQKTTTREAANKNKTYKIRYAVST